MERSKNMSDLDAYEIHILKRLIYAEQYEDIVKESIANEFITADCLRSLLRKKYISVWFQTEHSTELKQTFIFDSDKLQKYSFKATVKGLDSIFI